MRIAEKVNILGSIYPIYIRKAEEDRLFEKQDTDGYCFSNPRRIVIADLHSYKHWKDSDDSEIEPAMRGTLRHEIVHAFLNESGLQECSLKYGNGWAENEEMVDWIANQGAKIYAAWMDAGALNLGDIIGKIPVTPYQPGPCGI